MRKPDPLDAFDHGHAARLSLPFLPTLVTALVLGATSLLCREPAPAAPAGPAPSASAEPSISVEPSASVEPPAFRAALPAETALPRRPATIAFAEQYPLRPAVRIAAAAPHAIVRSPAGPGRRACIGQRCPEGLPRRPDPLVAILQPEPAAVETEAGDGLLPDLALPFATAARGVGAAAAFVRTGAASVGGTVSVLVDRMR